MSDKTFKVSYRTLVIPGQTYDYNYYYLHDPQSYPYSNDPLGFCCDGMSRQWGRSVYFGHLPLGDCSPRYDPPTYERRYELEEHFDKNHVNAVCIYSAYSDGCGEEIGYEYHEIEFCPFCGAIIVCFEVRRTKRIKSKVREEVEKEVFTDEEVPVKKD